MIKNKNYAKLSEDKLWPSLDAWSDHVAMPSPNPFI